MVRDRSSCSSSTSGNDDIDDSDNLVDASPIDDVFDFYQNKDCSSDLIRAEIDILVTDPIRNLKEKLRDFYIPVLDDYEIWLTKGKVSNECDSLFELSDVPYQYAKLKLEISHSLRRLTIVGYCDITEEKRAFNGSLYMTTSATNGDSTNDLNVVQSPSLPPHPLHLPQLLNEPSVKTELDLLIARLPTTVRNWTSEDCKLWTKICIKWFSLRKAKMRYLQISGIQLLAEDPNRFLNERLECKTKSDRFLRYFERLKTTGQFNRSDLIACKKTQERTYDNYKPPPVFKDFLRALLAKSHKSSATSTDATIIKWTDEKNGEFQLINLKEIARLWSAEKQRSIKSSSLLQSLTFYCDNGILMKISKKPRIFKFL